jgi:HK97 family phage major capsid protein
MDISQVEDLKELKDVELVLKGMYGSAGVEEPGETLTLGEQFTKSEMYQGMQAGTVATARMNFKTAIINATGQNQPLVAADRLPGIYKDPNRVLRIRDLMPVGRTSSNLVEFARENVFTNNAGPQVGGSPEAFENVTKPESGITFTLANEAVQTLAHWIPASKQVLEDSSMLESYINERLMYGLKLEEEDQLLNGSGANGNLNGLVTQATSYTLASPNITNEIDLIRHAILQAQTSDYRPNGLVLNPNDWYDIETRKVGASDDRYVIGDPSAMLTERLWGLPVVVTNSIASGTFLLGSFDMGAQIWDRQDASIEVSRENSDNFVKNMVTILAEERIALTVYRTQAFITGSL